MNLGPGLHGRERVGQSNGVRERERESEKERERETVRETVREKREGQRERTLGRG